MNKTKKILTISIAILILGIILMVIGIALGGAVSSISYSADGIKINTVKSSSDQAPSYKEETVALDDFDAIDIDMSFGAFTIQESDHFELYYKMNTRYNFTYELNGTTLEIRQNSSRNKEIVLYGTILDASEGEVIISIPKGTKLNAISADLDSVETNISEIDTASLTLSLSFGNLNFKNCNLGDTVIDADSVNISMENVSCKSMKASNSFGHLNGNDLYVENDTKLMFDSCNIDLETVELGSLYCTDNFGTVNFKELSSPSITFDCDSVGINIKELISKKIEIENNFGDVSLGFVEDVTEYTYEIVTQFGSISLFDSKVGSSYLKQGTSGDDQYIHISVDSGSVDID